MLMERAPAMTVTMESIALFLARYVFLLLFFNSLCDDCFDSRLECMALAVPSRVLASATILYRVAIRRTVTVSASLAGQGLGAM